jgi:hypothetical protein
MNTRSLSLLLLAVAPFVAWADSPAGLRVFPARIDLQGKDDRQSVVVQLVDSQGVTKDVTAEVKMRIADAKLAAIGDKGIAPLKDGSTRLIIEHGGLTADVPLVVKNASQSSDISFRRDVMPVFMKHGCNNGSCHGAARGKDGFMLSLFGYDPAGDYFRLTRQIVGRRIDLAVPEKSLMLEKTTGMVPHTGGKLFDSKHDDYQAIFRWLKAGAPDDGANTPVPVRIELLPPKIVFTGNTPSQKTVVMAKYSDGSVRDVTKLALYMGNNEAVATIGKDGIVRGGIRGGAFVFARFSKFTVGSEVIVLPTDDKFQWAQPAEANYIDSLVFDKLKKLRMNPSDLASDEAFLRRVYFDLIGLPPSPEERTKFVADKNTQKRAKLIDELIERPEFVDMWTMKWGELLRIRAYNQVPQYGRDAKAMFSYAAWVREQMVLNRPLNEMVAELVVGSGSNFKSPPANLYTAAERLTPQKTAEDIAQVFLGTRIQCAQCHNHPFDRWTLDDYYGFAAFFAGVNLRRGTEGREVLVINNNNSNTVPHPVDSRAMKPRFLGGDAPDVEGKGPRKALAEWMTSPSNAAFSQTMANIIWSQLFGRGIAEPVDDVRISNPPANKELLEELGKKLALYGFDKKKLVRDICNSRTYQLSSATNSTNELDEIYFSHGYVRRLRAEVLLDTITRVTDTEDRFPLSPPGTRAVQIHTGEVSNYFLTTFGRAPRETACSCEVNREANLSQALHLVNGDTISQKIAQSRMLATLISENKSPEQVIEELYVRALCRKPTAAETKKLTEIVKRESTDPARIEALAKLQGAQDPNLRRVEERVAKMKEDLKGLPKGGNQAAQLERQIRNIEQQLSQTRGSAERAAKSMVYGDILWGLLNSTEFSFNH